MPERDRFFYPTLPGPHPTLPGQTRILEWVIISFSIGSSQPRDQTRVSCIAGGFFTNRATREALLRAAAAAKSLPSCLTLWTP